MPRSLRDVMSAKSNEGLMNYLDNFDKYTPEAITAAMEELKRRGKQFSDAALIETNLKIQARVQAEKEEYDLWSPGDLTKNIVTDPGAPLFYSKGMIGAFSILFSVVFGAVLLALNITDVKNRVIVITFGIIYTALTIVIANLISSSFHWIILLNTAGAWGLTSTFWEKYVGKEVKYRPKPISRPLVTASIITILFILALIYN